MPSSQKQNIQDQTIAFDMLKDSKFGIISHAKLSTEAANTELRTMLATNLDQCVQEHFQLSDLLISKGWYNPTNISQQLQADLSRAQQITATTGQSR
ncbi:spore coat protein [Sporomusa acidovorans]|uniref:Coat F domain protein n=1 Tax=Sporomusa acidovorans (strain ATCC 49682 / DSM 3132 / Mol) TaxID=1123286 RepID=A0ABZ3JBG2_SPOA4|nr:spore coat protein [Sporomusa acidovorans]OZC13224.1 coat F domain protein [Sporomusa acidovorans DSM 3132]SDE00668.1 Coat F domain-containing protein [Sporomusa acidovorans]